MRRHTVHRRVGIATLATVAAVGCLLLALTLVYGLPKTVAAVPIVDDAGMRRATDFLTHYTAGRMVLAGQGRDLYDARIQAAAQEAVLGSPLDDPSPFLLPPAAAFVFVPFSLLPFASAATLWVAFSVALTAASLARLWPISPWRGRYPATLVLGALVGTYPVGMNLVGANNAALWLAIYAFAARRYVGGEVAGAGLLLGLGALKPQLFLTAPVLLLARREWRGLAGFAVVAAGLAAASLAIVGPAGAAEYLGVLASDGYRDEVAAADAWRMLSLPALLRALDPLLSNLAVAAIVLAGWVLVWWVAPRAAPAGAFAITIVVGVVIDPHCFLYDGMVLFVPVLLGLGLGNAWAVSALVALWAATWATTFRDAPAVGTVGAIPWAVLPLLALAAAAARGALRGTDGSAAGGSAPPAAPTP